MRVELGSFTGVDTELKLPVEGEGPPKHLHLQKLTSLSGVLERDDGSLRLDDVRAGQVSLGAARWAFGSVELISPEPCQFEQLRLQLEVSDAPLDLDLQAAAVSFSELEIVTGDTRVRGVARMEGASLRLAEGQGTIEAKFVKIANLEVQLGSLILRVPALEAHGFEVGWGEPRGFHMAARRAVAATVEVLQGDTRLTALGNALAGFEVEGGGVYALSHEAESLHGEVGFGPAEAAAQKPSPPPAPLPHLAKVPAPRRYVDLDVLDALAGRLVAEGRFEIRLPGGLRRKLRIPLSLDITEGSVDYRVLEHSLPTFEDSLLDFSRHDDWLVLELGLPLLPTRGLGKQLLRWPLRSSDGTSKKGHQVRLAALPRFERPGARSARPSEPPSRESTSGTSSVRLERASLKVGPMELRLPPPSQYLDAALEMLTFDSAQLEGQIDHVQDASPPGRLDARFEALQVRLVDMAAGSKQLGANLTARKVSELRFEMAGLRPRGVRVSAEGLKLASVKYA